MTRYANIYKVNSLYGSMKNEPILNIKEQALEKIKSLQKIEPEFVLSWLGGLTDLEQRIISVMYIYNKALTIKDIMSSLIKNTYSVLASRDYPIGISLKSEFDFPFSSYCLADDKKIKQKIFLMSQPEAMNFLKKEIKFPRFRRIDKSIQDLISLGVVLTREGKLENEKIKGLYFLNPIIRTQLLKLKINKDNLRHNLQNKHKV